MSDIPTRAGHIERTRSPWHELWLKEDWWAIWLGLGIVLVAYILYANGSSIRWIAVVPPKWSSAATLGSHFAANWLRYVVQFAAWLALFTFALSTLGLKPREFLPAFVFLYALALVVFVLGQWDKANTYDLEPPLVALVVGLAVSNVAGLPRWLDAGFRVEFYIKTSIVLLGATLPFTLILWAGPVAIVQAGIVSIVTFAVIFWVAGRLGIDRKLAATLAAGGAVCGVSAAIAVAGAVGAKKDDAPIAITVVILWAIVMIFVLPLAAAAFHLSGGVAGAWIGTSEFADAAGLAAADAYGRMSGAGDQTLFAFTLMKVVGRDIWIGIWAFALAYVSITRWEPGASGRKPDAAEIWWRFPKFVLGFVVASAIVTAATAGVGLDVFNKTINPALVAPIKDLRSWTFIFCFLSIGLTTRFRDLARAGTKPFAAFSVGVVVNVVLGFVLSASVFAAHWQALAR